jgi:hypothetical protein
MLTKAFIENYFYFSVLSSNKQVVISEGGCRKAERQIIIQLKLHLWHNFRASPDHTLSTCIASNCMYSSYN